MVLLKQYYKEYLSFNCTQLLWEVLLDSASTYSEEISLLASTYWLADGQHKSHTKINFFWERTAVNIWPLQGGQQADIGLCILPSHNIMNIYHLQFVQIWSKRIKKFSISLKSEKQKASLLIFGKQPYHGSVNFWWTL